MLIPNSNTFIAISAIVCSLSSTYALEGWVTDLDEGFKQAKAEHKYVIADFTGSDWCGACKMLKAHVLDNAEFNTELQKTFVPVELDFPRDRSTVEAKTMAKRESLLKDLGITGFPTLAIFTAEGAPLGMVVGGSENAKDVMNKIQTVLTTGKEFINNVENAFKKSGIEQAKSLVEAIKKADMPESWITNYYPEILTSIQKNDPKDETGYAKAVLYKARLASEEKNMGQTLVITKKNGGNIIQELSKMTQDSTLLPETQQKADFFLVMSQNSQSSSTKKKTPEELIQRLEKTKNICPTSDLVPQIDTCIKQIQYVAEHPNMKSIPATKLQ